MTNTEATDLLRAAMDVCYETAMGGTHAAHNAALMKNRIDTFLQHAALASLAPAAVEGDAVERAWTVLTQKINQDLVPDELVASALAAAFPALTAQVAQCDGLRKELETALNEAQRLRWSISDGQAELDRLKPDAARYRWLVRKPYPQSAMDYWEGHMYHFNVYDPKRLGVDAAIDSAIAAGNGEGV